MHRTFLTGEILGHARDPRYLRAGRHRIARGRLRGIGDRRWAGVSAAGSPARCCGCGRGCQGGRCRYRACGAGPVGAVLHIRPGPAVGGSAESCGNASAFNAGETLPCADRPPLHMGERRREVNDSREPRNPAENLESARGAAALPCAIRTPGRPGGGPAPPGRDGQAHPGGQGPSGGAPPESGPAPGGSGCSSTRACAPSAPVREERR